MSVISPLTALRARGGARLTAGLTDEQIEMLATGHPDLVAAISAAADEYARIKDEATALLDLDEQAQIAAMQTGFVNFYADDAVVPYIALAARGPWVVTLKGAVVYDAGGYGMLGFGHTPADILEAAGKPQVMANIMTPSLSQGRFIAALPKEIGRAHV